MSGDEVLLLVALEMRDQLERVAEDLPHGYDRNLCKSLVRKLDKELEGPPASAKAVET